MKPTGVQPARTRAATHTHARTAFALAALVAVLTLLTATVSRSLAAPPPPANPVLLVTSATAANKFGNYMGEVLRAEGFNSFQTADLADVTGAYLGNFSLVVLTEVPLSPAQATMFSSYVGAGGHLIAMRPDAQLAGTLGLVRVAGGSTAEGYLLANAAHPIGAGITPQTLQIHGVADHYTLNSATSLATLYSSATSATAFPAVSLNQSGAGMAAAFTYDLARSVAYTRQGNPDNFLLGDFDGDGVIRSIDGFLRGYLDVTRARIPQADEHQRLLANLIVSMRQQAIPLPRLWYFPEPTQKSLVVVTGDDHGQVTSRFQNLINVAESHGGRMTFYLARYIGVNQTSVEIWRQRGHEIGLHPFGNQDGLTLAQGYTFGYDWFTNAGYGMPSRTERNHQIEGQGWTGAARIAQTTIPGLPMEMSVDVYHWGSWLTTPDGQRVCSGYPNGSGLAMPQVDEAGQIVPVYQQATHLVDEMLLGDISTAPCQFSAAQAVAEARGLIDRAVGGYYTAVTMQAHTDWMPVQWLDGVLSYAQSKGMPIWTTEHWNRFTRARHDAIVDQIAWNPGPGYLTFRISSTTKEPTVTVLLPARYPTSPVVAVAVDGFTASSSPMTLSGIDYAAVKVPGGDHTVTVSYKDPITYLPTPTLTATPTNTVLPTLTPTPTATPQVFTSRLTDTLAADFGAGAPAGVAVAHEGDGELRRPAGTESYFDAPPSSADWVAGTWTGGPFNPNPAGGVLTVQATTGSAWLRSVRSYSNVTLEGRAAFANGPWEHIGFADDGFAGRYAILSTAETGTAVYARTFEGGAETRTMLPSVSLGSYHNFRIVWGTTTVDYVVDGVLMASHPAPQPNGPMYVYASNDFASAAPTLDFLRVAAYPAGTGIYLSDTKDVGAPVSWGTLTWSATLPSGTSLTMETRSSNDAVSWSVWTPVVASGDTIASPASRYLQYRASLTGSATESPRLDIVSVNALLSTVTPTQTRTATPTLTPTQTATPTQTPTATATFTPSAPVVVVGTQALQTQADSNAVGQAEAFQYTATASGTVNQLAFYLDAASTSTTVHVGLYSNSATDNGGTLLTSATTTTATRGAWNILNAPPASVTSGTKYWIALLGPTGSTGQVVFRDAPTGGKAQVSSASNLAALPATWTAGANYSNSPMSAYAIANGVATPAATQTFTRTPTITTTPAAAILVGDAAIEPVVDSNAAGLAEAFLYTATSTGAVGQLVFYLDASSTTTAVHIGLYANLAGDNPGALLTQGISLLPTKGAWNSVPVPAASVTAGTKYWIALLGPVGSGQTVFRNVATGAKAQVSALNNLTGLPTTWASGASYAMSPLSAYAVAGAGGPTATITSTPTITNTPTITSTPTRTSTPSPTSTVLPGTPSLTPTSTPILTLTPTPTFTRTSTPTATVAPVVLIGDQTIEPLLDSNAAGLAEAFQYTAVQSGTVGQLAFYLDATSSSTTVQVGLYTSSASDSAGTLLTSAATTTAVKGAWNRLDVPTVAVTAGTRYWIAILTPFGTTGTAVIRDVPTGGKAQVSSAANLTALPPTWTAGATYTMSPMSAYAIATGSGGATATATPSSAALVGDSTIQPGVDANPAGVAEAFQYTAASTGTVRRLWVYVDAGSSATSVVLGLYGDTGTDSPATLLAQGTLLSPVVGGWNAVSVPATSVTVGTRYWLAILGPAGAGSPRFRDVPNGGRAQTSSLGNLSALPATWTTGASFQMSPMSAYADAGP